MSTAGSNPQDRLQVLCFGVAEEAYALPILKVREIQAQATLTRIPKAPPYMPGVINLRGAIVPILDLRQRFSLGGAPEGSRPVIIIVEVLGRTLGLRVDCVSDVLDLDPASVRPAPELDSAALLGHEFIAGLASLPGSPASSAMLILLDLERLLSDSEMKSIDQASA